MKKILITALIFFPCLTFGMTDVPANETLEARLRVEKKHFDEYLHIVMEMPIRLSDKISYLDGYLMIGHDVNHANENGETLLHIVSSSNKLSFEERIALCEALIKRGANTQSKDHAGNTPCDVLKMNHLSFTEQKKILSIMSS